MTQFPDRPRFKLLVSHYHEFDLWRGPDWFAERLRKEFPQVEVGNLTADERAEEQIADAETAQAEQASPVSAANMNLWPAEARLILSALQAGAAGDASDRRDSQRALHQVRAVLRLFSDPDGSAPWQIYTRDVSARSAGFITPHRLPLGYGGIVELPGVDGRVVEAHCTLFRCRQTAQGWYEGALSFHRPQWELMGQIEPETVE